MSIAAPIMHHGARPAALIVKPRVVRRCRIMYGAVQIRLAVGYNRFVSLAESAIGGWCDAAHWEAATTTFPVLVNECRAVRGLRNAACGGTERPSVNN
jgi:hypothetical protein